LDEYKGPITRTKSKKLHILEIERNFFQEKKKVSDIADREDRNEEIREERHEERREERHKERHEARCIIPRRRIRESPLNLQGEQHEMLVLPKGTLKTFSGDGTIDAKRNFDLF